MADDGDKNSKLLRERSDVYTAARKIAQRLECDIAIINGDIERHLDNTFILRVRKFRQAKTLLLLLVTPGGSADAAYRIARCAQDNYERFIVFVSGYCKSAGTLCVLGANEVVMSDQGELGPLDVQLYKKDELGEMHSGLVIGEALQTLQQQAFSMFEHYFLAIKRRSAGTVTFKTATETAAKMVTGLFQPIYSQIDPNLIGDIGRSMTIAKDYGQRLLIKSQNFTSETLTMLVESYSAHGFVIDRREAGELFVNVRAPEADEEALARALFPLSRFPRDDQVVEYLYPNTELEQILKENDNDSDTQPDAEQAANHENGGSGTGRDDGNPPAPEGTQHPDPATDDAVSPRTDGADGQT
ncbi:MULTISPECIES: SDH family Clp fold serine proteinase [pseudomallei group]|uniref:SDH family Clp fold serine proteinase n=2 Tax=Bacteria TaxID=2 RepID=UPI000975ED3B|nr:MULTISPECIES: hypothetical protein [pseudomallei group]MBF3701497.1 SppA protein [Burkholderia pseudomallei]MBF3727100.1 SppA protein [Burkholderia pseudomallei]MBF4130138.1 SppA protein [Burkholderia pseudomallei]MCS3396813.1 hypothetical protein [Burkholderia thailandensis]MDV2141202.1 hypothetical protein [Burkholderia pseudomallei]